MTPVLQTIALEKRFGGVTATDNLSLDLMAGELHAVIGPNGAGKTTLIAQLSGQVRPTGGQIRFLGDDVTGLTMPERARRGITRSFQITSIFPRFTALGNVAMAVQARQGHGYRFWRDARRDPRLTGPALQALERVGLSHKAQVTAGQLAHGEQRQLELAMALVTEPRVLLLDEPMAGMSSEESARVVGLLADLKGQYAILLVEHDMNAVFALADRISVLVYGRCIASGRPEAVRDDPAVLEAYLGEEEIDA